MPNLTPNAELETMVSEAMRLVSSTYTLPKTPHFLISRTDNLGDVILTLPMCGLIKQIWPGAHIGFVGKPYTQPILEACQWVDQFWDRAQLVDGDQAWQAAQYDVAIFVFPDREVAKAVKQKEVKYRVGTSHRWWHWLTCNIRPNVGRKQSDLHEAQLNVALLGPFFSQPVLPSTSSLGLLFGLAPVAGALFSLPTKLPELQSRYVVLHPKSAGSAREWPLTEYAALARRYVASGLQVVVTGTEKEGTKMRSEGTDLFAQTGVLNATGRLSLAELIALLAKAEQVVACSTGPLHIGSAMGVPVVGIYPPIRPMHPGRWAPIGPKARVLVADKSCEDCRKSQNCVCIQQIRVPQELLQLGQ